MTLRKLIIVLPVLLFVSACNDLKDIPPEPFDSPNVPETYIFERNGNSTIDFNGQTMRIKMAQELVNLLKDPDGDLERAIHMFRNEGPGGSDVDPFSEATLNASDKSIRSKVAASRDLFHVNTVRSEQIRQELEGWINAQFDITFVNKDTLARPGVAGQIADGSSTRYVGPDGLEYDQAFAKSLIGALMTDQMLNNYLSTAVLDEGDNVVDNDAGLTVNGKDYTTMEHKWDEAYGYLFGNAPSGSEPLLTLGADDKFLNNYTAKVDADGDFTGIANQIFDAFKLGRACITNAPGFYPLRDEQISILRGAVSRVIAVRAVYYMEQGAAALDGGDMGTALHALSEGYGFINSLRFTRLPDGSSAYFSHDEVDQLLSNLMSDGPNCLWDVKMNTLNTIAEKIAGRFGFTQDQAAN